MTSRISLDVNFALDGQLGKNGLSEADLEAIGPKVKEAHAVLSKGRAEGKIAFLDLPADRAAADAAKKLGEELRGEFENLLVLGIGGSSLGGKAVISALAHPFNQLLPASKRKGARVFFPDNSDPTTFASLLEAIDLKKTAIAAITKSGGTAETWAQLLHLRQTLGAEASKQQIVAITDPAKGALRQVATSEGWRTLPVPPAVGGRFSVLTAVGLLPIAAAGLDVDGILAGAADMVKRCSTPDLKQNPAYLFATLLHLMDVKKGRKIHVFMPYADALRDTADWFVQLWAESLAKGENVGPTPIRAVGATDQHSLLQLLMEGPQDKMTVFVTVDEPKQDLPIPKLFGNVPDVAYLGGHTFHALLSAEQRATAAALASTGRPSMTLKLSKLDAQAVGELLMMLEIATGFAGPLYGVNPYDQPGVEAGKRFTCGLLGRPGYEDAKADLDARPPSSARWVV